MRALLLAAGFGTRLRPVTDTVPKCLVAIGGRPLIDYWLSALAEAGIKDVLINTHYRAEQMRAHIAAGPWAERCTLVHEETLLGTGGTIKANRAFFGGESFLVIHADNLTDFPMRRLVVAHCSRAADILATMLLFHTDTPSTCGIVELDGADRVIGFHEKVADPPGTLANGAVYAFDPVIHDRLAAIPSATVDLSTEVIPGLVGRIQAVTHHGYFRDIGTLESLAQARRDLPAALLCESQPA